MRFHLCFYIKKSVFRQFELQKSPKKFLKATFYHDENLEKLEAHFGCKSPYQRNDSCSLRPHFSTWIKDSCLQTYNLSSSGVHVSFVTYRYWIDPV